jgi:DNA-binding beta-propeller fold protein YncE
MGITIDSSDNLYIVDRNNYTIRKITSDGVVSTIAGASKAQGSADGQGNLAYFRGPTGIAVDSVGNLFVTDSDNNIRKITPSGCASGYILSGDKCISKFNQSVKLIQKCMPNQPCNYNIPDL